MKIKLIGAAVGSIALLIGVGVDVAHAGTYPSGGTYHDGGEGSTVEPQPDPTKAGKACGSRKFSALVCSTSRSKVSFSS